jgi:hypothetical protein
MNRRLHLCNGYRYIRKQILDRKHRPRKHRDRIGSKTGITKTLIFLYYFRFTPIPDVNVIIGTPNLRQVLRHK